MPKLPSRPNLSAGAKRGAFSKANSAAFRTYALNKQWDDQANYKNRKSDLDGQDTYKPNFRYDNKNKPDDWKEYVDKFDNGGYMTGAGDGYITGDGSGYADDYSQYEDRFQWGLNQQGAPLTPDAARQQEINNQSKSQQEQNTQSQTRQPGDNQGGPQPARAYGGRIPRYDEGKKASNVVSAVGIPLASLAGLYMAGARPGIVGFTGPYIKEGSMLDAATSPEDTMPPLPPRDLNTEATAADPLISGGIGRGYGYQGTVDPTVDPYMTNARPMQSDQDLSDENVQYPTDNPLWHGANLAHHQTVAVEDQVRQNISHAVDETQRATERYNEHWLPTRFFSHIFRGLMPETTGHRLQMQRAQNNEVGVRRAGEQSINEANAQESAHVARVAQQLQTQQQGIANMQEQARLADLYVDAEINPGGTTIRENDPQLSINAPLLAQALHAAPQPHVSHFQGPMLPTSEQVEPGLVAGFLPADVRARLDQMPGGANQENLGALLRMNPEAAVQANQNMEKTLMDAPEANPNDSILKPKGKSVILSSPTVQQPPSTKVNSSVQAGPENTPASTYLSQSEMQAQNALPSTKSPTGNPTIVSDKKATVIPTEFVSKPKTKKVIRPLPSDKSTTESDMDDKVLKKSHVPNQFSRKERPVGMSDMAWNEASNKYWARANRTENGAPPKKIYQPGDPILKSPGNMMQVTPGNTGDLQKLLGTNPEIQSEKIKRTEYYKANPSLKTLTPREVEYYKLFVNPHRSQALHHANKREYPYMKHEEYTKQYDKRFGIDTRNVQAKAYGGFVPRYDLGGIAGLAALGFGAGGGTVGTLKNLYGNEAALQQVAATNAAETQNHMIGNAIAAEQSTGGDNTNLQNINPTDSNPDYTSLFKGQPDRSKLAQQPYQEDELLFDDYGNNNELSHPRRARVAADGGSVPRYEWGRNAKLAGVGGAALGIGAIGLSPYLARKAGLSYWDQNDMANLWGLSEDGRYLAGNGLNSWEDMETGFYRRPNSLIGRLSRKWKGTEADGEIPQNVWDNMSSQEKQYVIREQLMQMKHGQSAYGTQEDGTFETYLTPEEIAKQKEAYEHLNKWIGHDQSTVRGERSAQRIADFEYNNSAQPYQQQNGPLVPVSEIKGAKPPMSAESSDLGAPMTRAGATSGAGSDMATGIGFMAYGGQIPRYEYGTYSSQVNQQMDQARQQMMQQQQQGGDPNQQQMDPNQQQPQQEMPMPGAPPQEMQQPEPNQPVRLKSGVVDVTGTLQPEDPQQQQPAMGEPQAGNAQALSNLPYYQNQYAKMAQHAADPKRTLYRANKGTKYKTA